MAKMILTASEMMILSTAKNDQTLEGQLCDNHSNFGIADFSDGDAEIVAAWEKQGLAFLESAEDLDGHIGRVHGKDNILNVTDELWAIYFAQDSLFLKPTEAPSAPLTATEMSLSAEIEALEARLALLKRKQQLLAELSKIEQGLA
tara:strand:+ start:302 stop:739 length:438 start_codon:yes stop_codon:yes gene_type:complete